jgi:TRAP-type C4-dicarboxylate transport system permease small subunit
MAAAAPRWSAALHRVERGIAHGERALIVGLIVVMTTSVFLDALHRVFAAGEGRSERLLRAILPEAAGGAASIVAPVLLVLVTFAISYGALATRERALAKASSSPAPSVRTAGRRGVIAAAITAGLAAFTQALVFVAPNGLVFSQQMSLCFLLWMALAGASLGARERAHIYFELAGQIWPVRWRRAVERLARVLAAGFTLLLALLAARHAHGHYREWVESDGAAGLFEAFPVPRFVIFGFLPLPLVTLAFRFLLFGVRPDEPRDEPPAEPTPEPAVTEPVATR